MKSINITKEGIVEYYGNRAGFIRDKTAYMDEMFKRSEIEEYLTKNALSVQWQKDIYDRLIKGEISDTNQITLKMCRIYQLKADTDYSMRFIDYSELKKRGFGEPNISNYNVVYDGNVGTNELDEIYLRFEPPDMPEGFEESGIYISDVIELYDDTSREFYYINQLGFIKLDAFCEPRMRSERTFDKEEGRKPQDADKSIFEAIKQQNKEPLQKSRTEPVKERVNNETTPVKEQEFQVETFKITM